jgi:hypothetical protein
VEWLTVKKKAESERNRLFLIFLCLLSFDQAKESKFKN